jgi:hypothetical protein
MEERALDGHALGEFYWMLSHYTTSKIGFLSSPPLTGGGGR